MKQLKDCQTVFDELQQGPWELTTVRVAFKVTFHELG